MPSIDWQATGPISSWVSALTPLILAGVVSKAIDRTGKTLKGALQERPRTLRRRLRQWSSRPLEATEQHDTHPHHHPRHHDTTDEDDTT
ncbi:hypothetical protein [Streptomyces noursei]